MTPLRMLAIVAITACFSSGVAIAQPHCPPGQAKKGNCERWYDDRYYSSDDRAYEEGYRDGRRDARWEIGRRLPDDVRYVVIRDYDRYHLRPPPRGHYYAEVDGRILLIQAATQLVLEALIRN
jgi:Ni/Co efflux regulator RcnB